MTAPPNGPTWGATDPGEDPTQVSAPPSAQGSYPAPPQWQPAIHAPGLQQQSYPAPTAAPRTPAWRRWAAPAGIAVLVVGAATVGAVKYSSKNSSIAESAAPQSSATAASTTTTTATSTTETSSPSTPPAPSLPPPPPVIASEAVGKLLLSPAQINTIMGTKNLIVPPNGLISRPLDMGKFTPPECASTSPGVKETYGLTSNQLGIAVQSIRGPVAPSSHNVVEVVATFADADAARQFLDQRLADWRTCSGQIVTQRFDDGTADKVRIGPTSVKEDVNYLTITNTDATVADGMVCQRAMTAISNVVIDTQACSKDITTQAIDIAQQIRLSVH